MFRQTDFWLGGLLLTWSLSVQGRRYGLWSDWSPFTVPERPGQQVSGILCRAGDQGLRKAGYDAVVRRGGLGTLSPGPG